MAQANHPSSLPKDLGTLRELEKQKRDEILKNFKKLGRDLGTVAIVFLSAVLTYQLSRSFSKKKTHRKEMKRLESLVQQNQAGAYLAPRAKSTIMEVVLRKVTEVGLDILEDRVREQISSLAKKNAK